MLVSLQNGEKHQVQVLGLEPSSNYASRGMVPGQSCEMWRARRGSSRKTLSIKNISQKRCCRRESDCTRRGESHLDLRAGDTSPVTSRMPNKRALGSNRGAAQHPRRGHEDVSVTASGAQSSVTSERGGPASFQRIENTRTSIPNANNPAGHDHIKELAMVMETAAM